MLITDLTGKSELLTDYKSMSRKRKVNGEHSISFLLLQTERNEHSFSMVEEESKIEYEDHTYRIKSVEERLLGNTPVKMIAAPHTFFDIVDEFRYTTLTTGFKSINEVLSFIFNGTNWTFTVVDTFSTVEFENFGNDNCLSLFQKAIERYKAEFELSGNQVIIRNQIGSYIDLQFRYNHNVKTFRKNIDSGNLSTYIKGTGKQNEDGSYVVTAEYTSPMADIYGIRHAPPYSNGAITSYETLLNNMKSAIQDTPEISIDLDFVILKDAGYTKEIPGLGDVVPTIYEPINVDVDLRVLEIEDYPETKKSPKVTLSTHRKTFVQSVMNYQKSLLDKIWDENSGKIRYNVYSDAVKRATEALNNSLTELEYPEGMGILARDPNNPNRIVVFRSEGIGISEDNGQTFKTAIYSGGVVTDLLTAGQIHTNNIQIIGNDDLFYWDGNQLIAINAADPNKYVKLNSAGLEVRKGMIDVERDDGLKTLIGGKVNQDFNLQGSDPPHLVDAVVNGRFFETSSMGTNGAICNLYTFSRIARYLVFQVAVMSQVDTAQSRVIVTESGLPDIWLGGVSGFSTTEEVKTFYIDLGVPDGSVFAVQMRLKTYQSDSKAYCRTIRAYQTDFLPQGV